MVSLTELYAGANLSTLNMIFEAQGKDYRLINDGEEIIWQKRKEKKDGVSVTKGRRNRVQSFNS